ncbi:hypothetical protein HK103_006277 [Boothiomyces macroporosus]|uniref:Ran GTPase-activating protein n=1 Tax=Boothiomyces macroporosus TaxID=261099 RepID=A0AAD5UI04_9FUNG|nr:hypothetical protein HK103_006277 [Boothiomyces macroporosus]
MELSKNLSETKLEKLKLNGNNITDSGAIALAKGLAHSKLNHLDLSYNRIGREGLCKLSEAIPLSKLNYFEIEANDHQPDDLAELYKVLDNSCLVELKVPEGGPLSENALINSINRSKVEELEVNISPDNLGALFVALQGSAVKKLTLAFEDAIVERIDIVSQFLGTCTVKELYFNTNFTYSSDEVSCSKLFVNQSKTGSLTLLDISDIALDGKEFNMIANQLPNTNLEALEILYPDISDADLYNLGVNIAQSALVSFTLCATAYTNYRLTSEGVIEFIKTVNGTRLRHLEFSSSNLSKQDHRKIRDILGNSPSLVIYFGS